MILSEVTFIAIASGNAARILVAQYNSSHPINMGELQTQQLT
jgi:hypothetical protein